MKTKEKASDKAMTCPLMSVRAGKKISCKPNCALYHPENGRFVCIFQALAQKINKNLKK